LKIERERYPQISQPATPQMKHTWVVLDLARIIPHPRLSSTHRANTATHVEQTHTHATLYTRSMKRYMDEQCRNLRTPRLLAKKRAYPSGKNYSRRMYFNLTLKIVTYYVFYIMYNFYQKDTTKYLLPGSNLEFRVFIVINPSIITVAHSKI